MTVIKLAAASEPPFVFGDARFRILYGPTDEQGQRPVVGLIREDTVAAIEDKLACADPKPEPR